MAGLETFALKLGGTIATHAAKSWLQRRKDRFERAADLAELAAQELKGPLEQRKLENLVQTIGTQVAEQLEPVLADRFATLPGNEVNAAFLAVEDALNEADLSDEALLSDDLSPEKLARRVREGLPDLAEQRMLAPRATALYELALDLSCRHLVQIIRHLPSFQPRTLVELLGRLSRQSEQLEELLARLPKTALDAPVDTDSEFRAEYLDLLARKLDRLELLGLPMDDQPALPLSVAYLSLSVSATSEGPRLRDHGPDELWFDKRHRRDGHATMRVETAIGGQLRTLVRGEAGSGKTTLLDWLAVTAARGGFTGKLADWNGYVAFPVRLRSFAAEPPPGHEDFVAHVTPTLASKMPRDWTRRVLDSGKAMVLVDGVDEVGASHRREIRNWLNELTLTFPKARFVVTSRTAAADQNWLRQQGFGSVLLEPMSADDIQTLTERWHQAASGTARHDVDLAAVQRRLLNQLDSHPQLRKLAASPLLCAMLCALNLAHRSELPRDRMDLYRKAMAMLMHLRDTERGIAVLLTESQKQVLLGDLAWRLTLAGKVELPREKVSEHVTRRLRSVPRVDHEPAAVLDHLVERSGVLREPVRGRIDFVHRTFQEYLAASEATEHDYLDVLVSHAHLDTWWETTIMACGHAKHHQVGELLRGILDRADAESRYARRLRLLAAACLETVSDVDPEVLARVEGVIQTKLVPPRNIRETRSLSTIGPRILRYLPSTLDSLTESAAAATVRAAALTGGSEALATLKRYAPDPRPAVQRQLASVWRYFDPQNYVNEVLTNAPLDEGEITITTGRLLPYAKQLSQLSGLRAALNSTEEYTDLLQFSGIPHLKTLNATFRRTADVDLSPISEHDHLEMLTLMFAGTFTNIAKLKRLANLNFLYLLPKKPLRSITALGDMEGLQYLGLMHARDIEALADLPKLDHLYLNGCTHDIMPTAKPLSSVSILVLYDSPVKNMLQYLTDTFPNLKKLTLGYCILHDLSALSELPLTSVEFQDATVGDLRPLAAIPTLKQIEFTRLHSNIDLSPLADLDLHIEVDTVGDITGLDRLGPGVKLKIY
ncbi:NACHT domain-containing protein [Amycolatopsis sp. NPDC059027]|uniref:NACHT N-terminal Helical domain 1-containing protein n=1 Tax=Amycolatopsis sp. NPDC059027 TaxID=3346709 RepID=UPI0036709E01